MRLPSAKSTLPLAAFTSSLFINPKLPTLQSCALAVRFNNFCSSSEIRKSCSKMENTAETYNPDNVFKRVLDGQLPCHKIFETEHCIAILDAFPSVPGHSLLIPKANVTNCLDMSEEVAANLFKSLPRLCRAVQKATNCDGVNVLQNNGSAAGQVVFHSHIHVVPRYTGDGLFKQFQSSKEMISADIATEMLTKIKSHL